MHLHSIRLADGAEALVARALAPDGKAGYGFSLTLDATAARHMAEWHAGARKEKPAPAGSGEHAWERAWRAGTEIPWTAEPAFAAIRWLP